jgi:hypothetical protein
VNRSRIGDGLGYGNLEELCFVIALCRARANDGSLREAGLRIQKGAGYESLTAA